MKPARLIPAGQNSVSSVMLLWGSASARAAVYPATISTTYADSASPGSHIKGQKIPSSRATLAMGAPQQEPGCSEVFQHL